MVTDLVAHEDAHASERAAVVALLGSAQPGELWIADRHFCTGAILQGWQDAGAGFIVQEHARHPRLARQREWCACGRIETGLVLERVVEMEGPRTPWRRIELALDTPTEAGETTLRLWSNLPGEIGAGRIAELYRTRWRIEGLFGRLEGVLHSEMRSHRLLAIRLRSSRWRSHRRGHPRAALLGFAVALLAHNVLALLQRCVEQAHAQPPGPLPEVSCFHLSGQVRSSYDGLLIALPPEHWPCWHEAGPAGLAEHLLRLARHLDPRQVAVSKRKPKLRTSKRYVDGATARAHVATARVLAQAKTTP